MRPLLVSGSGVHYFLSTLSPFLFSLLLADRLSANGDVIKKVTNFEPKIAID